jgi:hypothetical protein
MSGGPVLNAAGEIVGLASENLRDENGFHLAVPISLIGGALRDIEDDPKAIPLDEAVSPIAFTAVVAADASGSRLPTLHDEGGLGDTIIVEAAGTEQSECDDDDGRTISRSLVDAKVGQSGTNTLTVDVRVLAQGGHFRTASGCLGDTLIGITGHDTSTNTSYQVRGTITVPVDPILSDKATLRWTAMPANSSITIVGVAGNLVVENLPTAGDGEYDVAVTERGMIVVNVSMGTSYGNQGSCCPIEDRVAAKISVERWMPKPGE